MLKNKPIDHERLTAVGRKLAFPELPQGLVEANEKVRETACQRWPFDAEALLADARAATGLDDFGEGPFRESLGQLCASAESELDLSPVGRRNLHGQILDYLVQRLRFQDLWTRHPEILDEPVEAPVIIVGLPRSGTTFLQQLLASDSRFRPVPFWENLSPLPRHDPAIRPPDDAPLIEQAEKNVEGLRRTAPGLLALHQLAAEMPEEEIYLLGPGFASMVHEWVYILPGYARWFARQDQTPGYMHFRKVIQTLQWMRGRRGRWLLKAPQHMEQLKPLMAAFPDAIVAETLRDPLTSAASLANLCCYGQRLRTEHPDPFAAGEAAENVIGRLVEAYVRDRPEGNPQFVPVPFADLMAWPVELAEAVLAAAGMEPTAQGRAAMQAYVEENAKAPRHPVDYAPEDFGIDMGRLRARLQGYYRRFGVTPDPGLSA